MYVKTILIAAWISSYIFDGYPMGQPIDLWKFLVKFWSNYPVYIDLVYALETFMDVLYFLLAHQSMTV